MLLIWEQIVMSLDDYVARYWDEQRASCLAVDM